MYSKYKGTCKMENGHKKLKRNQNGELTEDKEITLDDWNERWHTGKTRFHVPVVHPMLNEFYSQLTDGKESQRIFIPCCGKSIDMKWLSDKGHDVVGADIAEEAAKQFFADNNLEHEVIDVPAVKGKYYKSTTSSNKVTIYCCDLYKITPEVIGPFDCIWDRGSFSAINVSDRNTYIRTLVGIMNENTRYMVSTFLVNHEIFAGPPHQCNEEDIKTYFGDMCHIKLLKKRDCFGPWQKDTWQVDYFYELIHLLRKK